MSPSHEKAIVHLGFAGPVQPSQGATLGNKQAGAAASGVGLDPLQDIMFLITSICFFTAENC